MKLLEQIHGNESQEGVFGSGDCIAFVVSGYTFIILLVTPIAGKYHPLLPTDPPPRAVGVQQAAVGQPIRVPTPP